ncbi:hypothetical protein D3C81_604050 [compost metagenome]
MQLIARIPTHRLGAWHQALQVAVCIEVTAEIGSFLTLFPWQGAVALWVNVHQATERIFITFMAQRGPVTASVVLVMFDVVEQPTGVDGAGDVEFRQSRILPGTRGFTTHGAGQLVEAVVGIGTLGSHALVVEIAVRLCVIHEPEDVADRVVLVTHLLQLLVCRRGRGQAFQSTVCSLVAGNAGDVVAGNLSEQLSFGVVADSPEQPL